MHGIVNCELSWLIAWTFLVVFQEVLQKNTRNAPMVNEKNTACFAGGRHCVARTVSITASRRLTVLRVEAMRCVGRSV